MIDLIRKRIASSDLVGSALSTFVKQVFVAGLQLLLVVLIARTQGPEGNGQYALAVMIAPLMANFLSLGVAPATVYFIGRKDVSLRQAMKENLRIWCVVALLGTSGGLIVIHLFGERIFPGVPYHLLVFGLMAFPVNLLLQLWQAILQGAEDFKAWNRAVMLSPAVTLGLSVWIIFSTSLGIEALILAFVAGQVSGLLMVRVSLFSRIRTQDEHRDFPKYISRTISYGWKAQLSNVMAFVNYRVDLFLVNFFISPLSAGIYVIAIQIAERLWIPSQVVSLVLLPRLSAMHQQRNESRKQMTERAAIITGVITLLISLFGAILMYYLVGPVFGESYTAALAPFYYLLPGVVVGASSRVLSNAIAAAGKPEWNLYAALVTVPINILLNILLIPSIGLIGAALATSVVYFLNFLLKLRVIGRLDGR